MAHRLPQLQRTTPPRGRHPFVYLAAIFLLVSFVAFIARIGMFWGVAAAILAILLPSNAIASILHGSGTSA